MRTKTILFRILIILIVSGIVIPAAGGIGAYYYFSYGLPRIETLKDYTPPLVTEVYSCDGELIGEFYKERRYIVDLAHISPHLIQAIIAAEDDRFFEHSGINIWSIFRAALKNIQSFEIRQGGSTITQQIVKSILLTPERSFSRKIREAILARRIERSLSKDEILTLYLNQIYFGRGAYGVEAAARVYFDKPAAELSLAESAFLAGLPKAPNYYRVGERALKRRHYVLERMRSQGYISGQQLQAADNESLVFPEPEDINTQMAPYFVEHVRQEIERRFGSDTLYEGGLYIETTLDMGMQKAAQAAVLTGLADYETRQEIPDNATSRVQGALLCLNPHSGHIKAMVGGRDFTRSEFNRALQAQRQPGSGFKPIIYAAALDKGYTPASIIVDSPVIFEVNDKDTERTFWQPQNYSNRFSGPTTFREALTHSRNIITIKIMKDIGIHYVIQYAKKLGINGKFPRDLSLALGTCGVSLLDMVKAYSAFCAQGVYANPFVITGVRDRSGELVESHQTRLVSAISPQTAYIMTNLLKNVVDEGTGWRVRKLNRPCAGKTGTTNDERDAWFLGYTPELVTGVWVGYDDYTPLGKHETGSRAASPIWLDFMQDVLEAEPKKSFSIPDGIVFVRIDPDTGYYPDPSTDEVIYECFKEGTLPTPFTGAELERVRELF